MGTDVVESFIATLSFVIGIIFIASDPTYWVGLLIGSFFIFGGAIFLK